MVIKDFNVVCINLGHRKDRWEESKREFEKAHLLPYVYRYEAISHENPVVGCAFSHFQVLESSLMLDKHAMVFEDDVKFIGNYDHIWKYLKELDGMNWDMLYLGGNVTTPIHKVSPLLAKISHIQSTHAYCVNKRFIPEIMEHEYLLGKHMDLIYAENIIPVSSCFITIPMLAIQRPSYSDIEKTVVDYSWMEDRYNRNLRKD